MTTHFPFLCLLICLCGTYAQEYLWYSTWDYDYPTGNSPLVRGTIQRNGSVITGLTDLETIALGASRGIAIDPVNQQIYWCFYSGTGDPGIYRSNFDGSDSIHIVSGVDCALLAISGNVLCYATPTAPICGLIQQTSPYVTNLNGFSQITSSIYGFDLHCISSSTCYLYWANTDTPVVFQKSTINTSVVPFQITNTTTLATVNDDYRSMCVDNSTDMIYYSESTGTCTNTEYAISSANPNQKCIFSTSWKLSIFLPPMCKSYLLYVVGDSDIEPGGGASIQLVDRVAGTDVQIAANVAPYYFAAYLTQCPTGTPVPVTPPIPAPIAPFSPAPVPPPAPITPYSPVPVPVPPPTPSPPRNLICTKLYSNTDCSGDPYDYVCDIGDICWNNVIEHCSATEVTTTYTDGTVQAQFLGCSTTGETSTFLECSSVPPEDIVSTSFYGSDGCSGSPLQGAYLQNVCYGEADPNPYSSFWTCEGENIVQTIWNSIDCTGTPSQNITWPTTCQGTYRYLCGNSTFSHICGSDATFSPHTIAALLCWFLLVWAV